MNYYLQPNGGLSPQPADSAAKKSSTSFTFDPRQPVPTIGGCISSGDGIMLQGAWDQRGGPHIWNWPLPIPLPARNDIVVFQTEPLNNHRRVISAVNTIYHDRAHPSHLVLPVVPK